MARCHHDLPRHNGHIRQAAEYRDPHACGHAFRRDARQANLIEREAQSVAARAVHTHHAALDGAVIAEGQHWGGDAVCAPFGQAHAGADQRDAEQNRMPHPVHNLRTARTQQRQNQPRANHAPRRFKPQRKVAANAYSKAYRHPAKQVPALRN